MRRLLSFTLATFFTFTSQAQALCTGENTFDHLPTETQAAIQQKVDEIPYSRGLLWQAEKDGRILMLMGTIHVADPRLDGLLDGLRPHVARADRVFLELTTEEEQQFQALMQSDPTKFLITSGPGLDARLSPGAWEKLTGLLVDLPHLGLPPEAASRLQPWFLQLLLATPACVFDSLVKGELGLDRRIENLALQQGVPTAGLDDPQAMFDLFSGDPLDEQIEDLEASAVMMNHDPNAIITLLETYFDGSFQIGWEISLQHGRDIAAAAGRSAWLEEAIAEMEHGLLTVRNQQWLDVLAKATGPDQGLDVALVAVGAAHLPGEMGLLKLLENAGWQISPMPLSLP